MNLKQYHSVKEFLEDATLTISVFGIIGFALKFFTFFDHWVYLPFFPNIFDFIFLVSASSYLFFQLTKRKVIFKHERAPSSNL